MKIIIGLLVLSLLVVGCNQKVEETTDREQYCLDRNMAFDDTYILQPNWTRCCEESTPTDWGTYRTNCETYQFNKIEKPNDSFNDTSKLFTYNNTIEASLTWTPLDYSETGYVQIHPRIGEKLIYIECVNSTLKINDTMMWCEELK